MATQLPIKLVLRNRSAVAILSDNKQDGTFLFKFIQGDTWCPDYGFTWTLFENISLSWISLQLNILISMKTQYVSYIHWKIPTKIKKYLPHLPFYSWKIQKDMKTKSAPYPVLSFISKGFSKKSREVFINRGSYFLFKDKIYLGFLSVALGRVTDIYPLYNIYVINL